MDAVIIMKSRQPHISPKKWVGADEKRKSNSRKYWKNYTRPRFSATAMRLDLQTIGLDSGEIDRVIILFKHYSQSSNPLTSKI